MANRIPVKLYYDGSGKFPMGTISGKHGNCSITRWKEQRDDGVWTEIQFDDGKFLTMQHDQIMQFLSNPVVDYAGCLREFHEKFDVPVRNEPFIPDAKDCLRRLTLMMSELGEFGDAIREKDLLKILDAAVDTLVVVFGTCIEFGLPIDEAFLMVHQEENMTKVWPDGKVHKDAGGKILKPPGHKPADLAKLLPPEKIENPGLPFGENGDGQ